MQSTSQVMMIEPVAFHFNEQTAETNSFMHAESGSTDYQAMALLEFNRLVDTLRRNGVTVNVFKDNLDHDTPDSIFPNNWITTHSDGRLVLYPMHAPNRRKERRPDIIKTIIEKYNFSKTIDLSYLENDEYFLESTGCLILDRINKIAYCALGERASATALEAWCQEFPDYSLISFISSDKNDKVVYHTNVVMALGVDYVILCLESVKKPEEKKLLRKSVEGSGKELIEISLDQVYHFAGNMLELTNDKAEKLLVMSSAAYGSLTTDQKASIEKYATIIHSDTSHIERIAGGSVRCMICEIFPPSQI